MAREKVGDDRMRVQSASGSRTPMARSIAKFGTRLRRRSVPLRNKKERAKGGDLGKRKKKRKRKGGRRADRKERIARRGRGRALTVGPRQDRLVCLVDKP